MQYSSQAAEIQLAAQPVSTSRGQGSIALAQGMSRKSVLAVFDAAEKASIGNDCHAGRSEAEVYSPGRSI
ncbi:hypothetical protein PA27867_0482 [Cryobacterium arcticum]|uniref:Uncharacterized protein n=1 Tax=Cryobacterium arcticum TaxID=670052 RepID=A0A1B1BG06_9MICO|nr:hypothetical protein PA27867_0482 [Cryobacterium arcticum]